MGCVCGVCGGGGEVSHLNIISQRMVYIGALQRKHK